MKRKILVSAALLLIAAACSQPAAESTEAISIQPAQVASVAPSPSIAPNADAPPLENGLYATRGACPFEGCQLGVWRARAATPLREKPDAAAPIAATIPADEWVKATGSVSLLVPQRGVVVSDVGELKKGDVIYQLEGEGEGSFTVWRRGEMLNWMDDGSRDEADPHINTGVRWDMTYEERQATKRPPNEGWWVHLQRTNGQAGWIKDPNGFDCMGQIDAEPACETAPKL